MSESKAEYYANHLEELVEGVPGIPSEPRPVETVQPTGLPTLLARMVNEYHGALKLNGYSGFPDRLVEGFSQMLLACAQPLLTEYLTAITTPPKFVVHPNSEAARSLDYARAEQAAERQQKEDAVVGVMSRSIPADAPPLERDQYEAYIRAAHQCAKSVLGYPNWRKSLGAK